MTGVQPTVVGVKLQARRRNKGWATCFQTKFSSKRPVQCTATGQRIAGHIVGLNDETGDAEVGSVGHDVRCLDEGQIQGLFRSPGGKRDRHPDPFVRFADAVGVGVVT